MNTLLILIAIALLVWHWSESTRARESAIKIANKFCSQSQVQFLDQTVALASVKLVRNERGQLKLQRIYRFEFCTTGTERYKGHVTMLAQTTKPYRCIKTLRVR